MCPDVSGLSMNHEDGLEALAEGVQLGPVTKPGTRATFH